MSAKIIPLFGDRDVITADGDEVAVSDILDDLAAVQQEFDYIEQAGTESEFWRQIAAFKKSVADLPSGP